MTAATAAPTTTDAFLPDAAMVHSNRQRLFLLYFVGALVDLVVLGLFNEYSDKVYVDTFTTMLLASIVFRVQPHKRDEALSAVDETLRRMRTAPGCARTRLVADTEDPNMLTVLSEWQTAASADSFFASREFQIFKGMRILMRDEPVLVIDDVRSRVTRLLRAPAG